MIRFEDVSFSYGSKSPALSHIHTHIERGSFVAVLGHNGSGKSSMAKLMNASLIPTEGNVYIDEMNTRDEDKHLAIRQKVGLVFQNPDNQIVATIVEEDVAFGPENLGVPQAEIRERVDDALRTVGMYAYKNHAPHLLSGGQKQRVAIAGIIAMQPECIVLDEPTAMLDPIGRQEVMDTILRLRREKNITVVLITHFMKEAAMADRVIVTENGRIIMDDVPQNVLVKRDELLKARLDVPQPTELLARLAEGGMPVNTDFISTADCVKEILSVYGKGKTQ